MTWYVVNFYKCGEYLTNVRKAIQKMEYLINLDSYEFKMKK